MNDKQEQDIVCGKAGPEGAASKEKLLSAMGLCKKAGKLVMGADVVAQAAEEGRLSLILTAQDLSPKSRKQAALVAGKYNIELMDAPVTMDEIWYRVGKRSGILGIADRGFTTLLLKQLPTV